MANPRWASTSSTSFTTAGNWDTGSAPVDADAVFIQNNAVSILTDLANSAIEPASLNIAMSYTGVIGGSSTTVNTLGTNYLAIGPLLTNIGTGTGTGSARIKLDFTSDPTTVTVYNTASNGVDAFLPVVRLIGTSASNKYYQYNGNVGWAVEDPDETSTLSEFSVAGGTLLLGLGVTWTTGYQTGGTVTLSSGGTTYTQQGGTLVVNGSDAIRNLTISGLCTLNARTATLSVSGITRSSTTATATVASTASLATGDTVRIMGADQQGYNGYKTITVAGGTTFTFACDDGDEATASGTITARQAIASLVVNGTLDLSNDSRPVDVAAITYGSGGEITVNKANPSHFHAGTITLSNVNRISVSD